MLWSAIDHITVANTIDLDDRTTFDMHSHHEPIRAEIVEPRLDGNVDCHAGLILFAVDQSDLGRATTFGGHFGASITHRDQFRATSKRLALSDWGNWEEQEEKGDRARDHTCLAAAVAIRSGVTSYVTPSGHQLSKRTNRRTEHRPR
jgi:hypothetical protein